MQMPGKSNRRFFDPDEVAKLGSVFDATWSEITSKGLLAGRQDVEGLRDLVGQMIWAFQERGQSLDEIATSVVEILTESASLHP